MSPAREVARRALVAVDRGQHAIDAIADAARAVTGEAGDDRAAGAGGLDDRDRRLAHELVMGVLRHRSRLDRALAAMTPRGLGKTRPVMRAALRVAAYQLLFLDRVPAHAAVDDAATAARQLGGARLAAFANSVLRRLAREGEPALPPRADALAFATEACSLPRWLAVRLADMVPAGELADAAEALLGPAPLGIRAIARPGQTARAAADDVRVRLRAERAGYAPGGDADAADADAAEGDAADDDPRAVPWCEGALLSRRVGDPARSASFAAGAWTVQDPGAQMVAHLVGARPGDRVLDACAGVGGKAAHLCELVASDDTAGAAGAVGAVVGVDRSADKLAQLHAALARMSLSGARTVVHDWTAPDAAGLLDGLPELAGTLFDAVVLDAPCSGLGVVRRHPEAKWRVTEADVARLAEVQRALLRQVAPLVRPGGVLVYAVCTFTRAEGPDQIRQFLQEFQEFGPAAPPPGPVLWDALTADEPAPGAFRTWPHLHDADAFYAARLVRRA